MELRSADELDALEKEAWSVLVRTERRAWLTTLCIVVFGIGGLMAVCAVTVISVHRDWGIFPLEIIVGTTLWVASWILIVWIPHRFKAKVVDRAPHGVDLLAMPSDGTVVGRVIVDDAHEGPIVTAVEVRCEGRATFRSAQSHGFVVQTDAEAIEVPSGRVRLCLPDEPTAPVTRHDGDAVADYAARCGMTTDWIERAVPHDEVWVFRLKPGDRVRLHATVEDVFDDDPTYRKHAARRRRAVGIPWLGPA